MGGGRVTPPVTGSPPPASRRHAGYKAFLAHRISGLALAVFLPLHFLALGLALEGEAKLQQFMVFTDHPVVKVAEWGLVILLGLHLMLGLRLVVLELGPWKGPRHGWINWGAGTAVAVGLAFLAVLAA